MVEVFGDEACGKTTLAIQACVQAQKINAIPMWLDYERSFDIGYAEALGLNTNRDNFIFLEPLTLEQGFSIMEQAIQDKNCRPALIVIDSVSAMTPADYLENKMDEMGKIGLQASLISRKIPQFTQKIPDSNSCILFLNQLRAMIKDKYDTGPREETSGGRALKYYTSLRINMLKKEVEKADVISRITGKKGKEPINVKVNVSIVKNKIDKPYYSAPIYIRFGEGIDNEISIVELACNTGIIERSGARYSFDVGDKKVFEVFGRENLRSHLVTHPEDYKLLQTVISSKFKEGKIKEDEQAIEAGQSCQETSEGVAMMGTEE
jgi:recombination protein RecA